MRKNPVAGQDPETPSGGVAFDPPEGQTVQERVLEAAERLFAEQGVGGTSVRAITAAAGANVASVSYYFGSREGLLREIVSRRLAPLNEYRLELLETCYRIAAPDPPDPEHVLSALANPALRLCYQHPYFARLASQLRGDVDRSLWELYRTHQAPLVERFRAALVAALPALPEEEVGRRLHYVLGAIHHVWAHCPLPPDTGSGETLEQLIASFQTFYTAGLRAPAPAAIQKREP